MEKASCFITGHRPARFKFKYNETYKLCIKIKETLVEQIKAYYAEGIRAFWVGGAIGVDTWAAEAILELRKQETHKDIELHVAIPFPTHGENFDPKQSGRYQRILRECASSFIVCPTFRPDAYKKRNYYMVDCCSCGIAVYDNNRSIRSGTGMTVNYARKKNCPIILIHPDTGAASAGQ